MRALELASLAAALLSCSCQAVWGFDDFTAAPEGAAGKGNGPVACADLAPPSGVEGTVMLATPREDDSCFWMDEHEVTQGQYAEFANDNPPGLSLPCSWNDQYYDAKCEDASLRITYDVNQPQVCVDQCDAEAYCRSVGKTLCRSSYTGVAARDDWGAACTNAGETPLPYGKTGALETCNVLGRSNGTTTSVRENSSCENNVGIRDLTGNVAEWTGGDDACATNSDADDSCLIRGGSFADAFQNTNCETSANPKRGDTFDYVGFRCCYYGTD